MKRTFPGFAKIAVVSLASILVLLMARGADAEDLVARVCGNFADVEADYSGAGGTISGDCAGFAGDWGFGDSGEWIGYEDSGDAHAWTGAGSGSGEARVVGHDIGLMVAYAYSAQFPAEVEKLVVMERFCRALRVGKRSTTTRGSGIFGFTGRRRKRW